MANNQKKKTRPDVSTAENDPCINESEATNACLRYNDKDECMQYIMNLKFCKEFWGQIKEMRRRSKTEPLLPPEEERAKVLKENYYMLAGKTRNWEDYVPESLR